ncbi:polyketide synthase dehydratase domain-containing protein, partial [Streptomyces sp. NPDC054802]
DDIRTLTDLGVTRFLELGPDGVLSAMATDSLPDDSDAAVLIPVLRKNRDEELSALHAVARLYVDGGVVNWGAFFAGTGARIVELPTYAFQHRRYWPPADSFARGGDVRMAGLESPEHPLLGAAVELADADTFLLTGRLSVQSHPWLADHMVMGTVLVPGTALIELVMRAGDEAGCPAVEELTIAAPLALPAEGGIRVQVTVGALDESGRRTVTVHSRPDSADDALWTQHATGVLAAGTQPLAPFDAADWPPTGAHALDVSDVYERFAEGGFEYGPVFQGMRAAWRLGDEVYTEVALPEDTDLTGFGLHPALFDAGLHAAVLLGDGERGVPFSWSGVSLHAPGMSALLRVRMSRTPDGALSVALADALGQPVASVSALTVRPVSAEQQHDGLFGVDWVPARVPEPVELSPDVVVHRLAIEDEDDVAGSVHALSARALSLVQELPETSRLVLVTRGAVSGADLAAAAAWGLVRSAQSEQPGRFVLVDVEGEEPAGLLESVLALDEPQLLVR